MAVLLFACCTTEADTLTANFNNFMGTQVGGSGFGRITLTLNGDGTVGAWLTANTAIIGLGIDSSINLAESNFSAGNLMNTVGWNVAIYGHFESGFDFWSPYPTLPITWTIGIPGQFTSVRQVIDGNGSAFDFALIPIPAPGQGAWGALAPPIPEPATLALVLLAGVMLAVKGGSLAGSK